jgi:predicted Zn-dependent protease with MMP-like domain
VTPAEFSEMERIAREVVADAMADLPDEVRRHALNIPVIYEALPGPEAPYDDCLGLFVGDPIGAADGERDILPPQIFIYLENLWDEAEGDMDVFCDEVAITFLHELGHYLGWDEEDLQERDLD